MKAKLLSSFFTLLISSMLYSQTATIAPGNWSDPSIWSAGVPTSTTDANVNHAVTVNVNASVRHLRVFVGGVVSNSTYKFGIYGNLTVDDPSGWSSTSNALVDVFGTNSSFTGKMTFSRLQMSKNKNTNTLTINDTIFITGHINFDRGNVTVNQAIVLVADGITEGNVGFSRYGQVTGNIIWQKYINRCNEWSTYSTPGRTLNPTLAQIASFSDMDGSGRRMIYTGFPGSDFPNFSFVNTYFYDESSGYQAPTSVNNNLMNGKGYWYWNSNEVTNSGNPSIPQQWLIQLTLNGFSGSRYDFGVTFSTDGFNLVGNPFPGNLDWDYPSWVKTNIDNAIYYWNTCTQSYASYINGVGSNGGDRWIPGGQGFWVQATAASPVLSVSGSALRAGGSVSTLKGNDEGEKSPFLSLRLNGDETVVRFNENTTEYYDSGFDAKKLLAPSFVDDKSSVRTVLNDVNFSVNTVPFEDLIIPLEVKGQGELTFDGANEFPEVELYLQDLETNELIDMKVYKTYNFTNIESNFTHRFNIIVKSTGNLAVNELSANKMSVYPNPFSSNVTIMTNGEAFDKVEVYNILGELVMSETNNGSVPKQINVSELNSGAYIIKVYNQGNETGTFLTQKQ